MLAAEWGSGRRKGWLSNIHLGARVDDGEGFVMLGKTFKGMTDEMLAWQTERLLELETSREGIVVHVRPEVVVEVAFDGLQASPRYPGGMALRFALAYLYAVGDADRRVFDRFFRVVQEPERVDHLYQSNYGRNRDARTCLNGICDGVGMPLTVDLMIRLRQARLPKEERERELAKERMREEAIAARIAQSDSHARGGVPANTVRPEARRDRF